MKYQDVYENWRRSPEDFWSKEAQNIDWFDKPENVLDASNKPFYNWFTGGSVNACYNCVDRCSRKFLDSSVFWPLKAALVVFLHLKGPISCLSIRMALRMSLATSWNSI